MRFLLCILLVFIIYHPTRAQYTPPHVGYFASRNAKKLATRLTANLNTEPEKIFAIHYWITHHIRYDVKRSMDYNYDSWPTKKVLHKRKATCVGYSSLFNELCAYSNIKSVLVPGYSKDPFKDLGDKCYVDDHAWNAVLCQGKWRLVDVTWDAGYLAFYKMPLPYLLLHAITFGKAKLAIKYSPHFVQYPDDTYYLKTGRLFKRDHLPLDPIWQLLPTEMTVKDFEQDSSFYYGRYDTSPDTASYPKYAALQDDYYDADDTLKTLEDGFNGHRFNIKNNFGIAVSWNILAHRLWDTIAGSPNSTKKQLWEYDTVLSRLDRAVRYYNLNDSLLHVQKKDLTDNNDLKKVLFKNHNGKVLRSEIKIKNSAINAQSILRSCSTVTALNNNANNTRKEQILKQAAVKTVPHNNPGRKKDSTELSKQLKQTCDSITLLNNCLQQYYENTDDNYTGSLHRITLYLSNKAKLEAPEDTLIKTRRYFYDDLDYPVIAIRDSFTLIKLRNDSLLFAKDTSLIREMSNKNKQVLNLYNRLYHARRKKIQLSYKMKLLSFNTNYCDSLYTAAINQTFSGMTAQNTWDKNTLQRLKNLSALCDTIYARCEKDMTQYTFEIKIENDNSIARLADINKRFAAFSEINSTSESWAEKLKTKADNFRKKLLASLKSAP